MAGKPVETADSRHYLRLLLLRLLETQKCLKPVVGLPQMGAVRQQYQENEYILSEIRSWLEGQESSSHRGQSPSSVESAETFGDESSIPSQTIGDGPAVTNPFVWRTYSPTVPVGTSQVRSSLPSGLTLPPEARIIRGQIIFRPPSSNAKPESTSTGGTPTDEDKKD